jgi:hypothetical protein
MRGLSDAVFCRLSKAIRYRHIDALFVSARRMPGKPIRRRI